MSLLMNYGPWGALVFIVWMFLRERRRADELIKNHLQHTYADHVKIMEKLDKGGEALQEAILRLRQMNGG